MTITDGLLWQATDQGRNWLVWTRRAAITIAIGAVGVLAVVCGERMLGYFVAGCAALVVVIGAAYLVWDRTRFLEIRLSEGPVPTLDIRMVTRRVVQVVLDDVARVELICTYPAYDPDYPNDPRTSDAVLLLQLSGRRGWYRSRARSSTSAEAAEEIRAEWQRRCPRATVTREVRFRTGGTND
ncbi:hypothetical protein AB0B66_13540 [Catellatospora sp. NPDC049111]|uniref:hypothetical protein n=1 Tax=Catellatospora sp. NPDC049111 TaxID=3155271 RepID=UPI0033E5DC3B